MTRTEKLQKQEDQRAKWRSDWHRRTKAKTKKARAYKARKAETKAAWQRANPEKNVAAVQRFRDRWGRWPAKSGEGTVKAVAVKKVKTKVKGTVKTQGKVKVVKGGKAKVSRAAVKAKAVKPKVKARVNKPAKPTSRGKAKTKKVKRAARRRG